MKRAVLIQPDGSVEPAFIRPDPSRNLDELQIMQDYVGGYLAYYEWNRVPNTTVLVDKDGISKKLPFNPLAHTVFGSALDPILGNALIMGPTDEEGDMHGLTVDQVNIFLSPAFPRWVRENARRNEQISI